MLWRLGLPLPSWTQIKFLNWRRELWIWSHRGLPSRQGFEHKILEESIFLWLQLLTLEGNKLANLTVILNLKFRMGGTEREQKNAKLSKQWCTHRVSNVPSSGETGMILLRLYIAWKVRVKERAGKGTKLALCHQRDSCYSQGAGIQLYLCLPSVWRTHTELLTLNWHFPSSVPL